MDIVKRILVTERGEAYVLRAKTGWARCWSFLSNCQEQSFNPQIGWWIGYVERGGRASFFAINMDVARENDTAARMTITRDILREMNIVE